MTAARAPESSRLAVVVDQWPLLRLGLMRVLETLDIDLVGEFSTANEALDAIEMMDVGLFVVGQYAGMKVSTVIKQAKALPNAPKVIVLLSAAENEDLADFVLKGADALLVRTTSGSEFAETVRSVSKGERVITPALVPLAMGKVQPHERTKGEVVPGNLTRKELAVLAGLAEGLSNRQIANNMFVTPATVKTHLAHIYDKLEVGDRHQALARALAMGLLG